MKKVLFATTALIATAGVASADVTLSGDARMGITHVETAAANDAETALSNRVRFGVAMSGTTDAGYTFGASIRADNSAGGAAGTSGSTYFSGSFGKISMGDQSSGHESATGDLAGVGFADTGLASARNEMGYIGGDARVAYSTSVNGVSVFASAGQSSTNEWGLGFSAELGGVTLGLGTAEAGASEQTSVSLRGSVAGIGLTAVFLDNNAGGDAKGESGVSATYAMDANTTLTVFHREISARAGADTDYTGFGVAYSLGGGASLKAGYVSNGSADNYDSMDLGLTFSF